MLRARLWNSISLTGKKIVSPFPWQPRSGPGECRHGVLREAGMRQIADLLSEALLHGDEKGRTQILGKHLRHTYLPT